MSPARLRIPAVRHLAQNRVFGNGRSRGDLIADLVEAPLRGVSTLPTNVQWASNRSRALLAKCERMIKARNLPGLRRLIDANPELALDYRVREALLKLSQAARYRRGPGRSAHSHSLHPLLVVGLVQDLIRIGQADNPEQAFHALRDLNISDFEAIRRKYYRARVDARFRGLLVELGQPERQSVEQVEATARDGEWLRPGGEIRRWVYFPPPIGDYVEVIFTATVEGPLVKQASPPANRSCDNTLVVTQIRLDGLDDPKG